MVTKVIAENELSAPFEVFFLNIFKVCDNTPGRYSTVSLVYSLVGCSVHSFIILYIIITFARDWVSRAIVQKSDMFIGELL